MLVVLVVTLVVLVIFGLMLRNVFDKKARMRRIARNGIEAKAVLLNINYPDPSVAKPKEVTLQIQVYPEFGRNFVTEVPGFLDYVPENKYQIGDSFIVKYNPVNTRELVITSV